MNFSSVSRRPPDTNMIGKWLLVVSASLLAISFVISVLLLSDDEFPTAIPRHISRVAGKSTDVIRTAFAHFSGLPPQINVGLKDIVFLGMNGNQLTMFVCRSMKDDFEIALYSRELDEFTGGEDSSWQLVQSHPTSTWPQFACTDAARTVVAVVFMTAVDEDARYTLRLYSLTAPNRPAVEINLPGSLPVAAVALTSKMIAYTRVADRYMFRTLVRKEDGTWLPNIVGPTGKPAQGLAFLNNSESISMLTGNGYIYNSAALILNSTGQPEDI